MFPLLFIATWIATSWDDGIMHRSTKSWWRPHNFSIDDFNGFYFDWLMWSTFQNCETKQNVSHITTLIKININTIRCRRGRDRMLVGFKTTYAMSAYHHWCCEFESRAGRGVHHYVIKFVSDLRQVSGFLRVLWFPPPIKLTATIQLKYFWK
jgi:hypothetical protein